MTKITFYPSCTRCGMEMQENEVGDLISVHYSNCVMFSRERYDRWFLEHHWKSMEARRNEKKLRFR